MVAGAAIVWSTGGLIVRHVDADAWTIVFWRGLFGGLSLFFDFQKHPFAGSNRSLISSTATVGYTWKCCMVTGQYYTFNVGVRNENRFVFAFRLNGIGTFGTEKIGQWVK